MNKLIEWDQLPIADIGEEVYVRPEKGDCFSSNVAGFVAIVIQDQGKTIAILKGYRLSHYNFCNEDPYASWPTNRVYKTLEEAEKDAKVTEVTDIPVLAWQQAIGLNADGTDYRELGEEYPAELEPCCGNISEARRLLLKCWRDGGLQHYDIKWLRINLEGHSSSKETPNLDKIFAQLNITDVWQEEETENNA